MCDGTGRSAQARSIPRPRWGLLYGLMALAGGALLAVEITLAPGATRTALDLSVACGAFVALGVGVRAQRAALDLRDWCDCATDHTTIRIILSRAPAVVGAGTDEPSALPDDPDELEEDERPGDAPERHPVRGHLQCAHHDVEHVIRG